MNTSADSETKKHTFINTSLKLKITERQHKRNPNWQNSRGNKIKESVLSLAQGFRVHI